MHHFVKDQQGQSVFSGLLVLLLGIVGIFAVIGLCAWVFSFHGVDPGHVAIVKEGGVFDGRSLKEVRQPGAGPTAIGAWNHQYSLPTTQRDLTEEAGNITVPTADGVNVNVDGQALFQLKVDGESDLSKNLDIKFFKNFGLRPWNGHNLWDDEGWVEFLKVRLVPILYQSIRSVIGSEDCTSLNNTCVYVLNADEILAATNTATKDGTKVPDVTDKAKAVNTSQNLAEAERLITEAFKQNLKDGLGDEYFEGVRFQNLRITFPGAGAKCAAGDSCDIQGKIQAAQGARADVARARLNAQKVTADATGAADAKIEAAKGDRDSNIERAKGVKALAQAYKENPGQVSIEKIKAFCGQDGCDPQAITPGFIPSIK